MAIADDKAINPALTLRPCLAMKLVFFCTWGLLAVWTLVVNISIQKSISKKKCWMLIILVYLFISILNHLGNAAKSISLYFFNN